MIYGAPFLSDNFNDYHNPSGIQQNKKKNVVFIWVLMLIIRQTIQKLAFKVIKTAQILPTWEKIEQCFEANLLWKPVLQIPKQRKSIK